MTSRLRLLGVAAAAAGVLAVLPASVPAAVQVGSSGWQWGNPLPQGNTIRAMSFGGLRGYAAGDFGTLLQTENGGTTWTGLSVGTFANLTEVQAVDSDTVVAGGGCVARRSDDGGASLRAHGVHARSRPLAAKASSPCRSPPRRRATSLWPTEPCCERPTAAPSSSRRARCRARAPRAGRRLRRRCGSPPTRSATRRRPQARSSRPRTAATPGREVNDTQRAVRDMFFADATTGYAVGAGGLFLKTTDGGRDVDPKGHRVRPRSSPRCAAPA